MAPSFKARDWHAWLSIILLLPLLLIGFTSFFLAHKKSLGLNDIDVTGYVGWLPGYRSGQPGGPAELRSVLKTSMGRLLIGTNSGLVEFSGNDFSTVAALAGMQVRDLAEITNLVVAATKEGVWLEEDGIWRRVLKGDAWNLHTATDGTVTATLRDQGFLTSHDGMTWFSGELAASAGVFVTSGNQEWQGEKISLGKLMIDLHTGKAFLGKQTEWLWIDSLAFVWVFLSFTGLWIWWRVQLRSRDAMLKQLR